VTGNSLPGSPAGKLATGNAAPGSSGWKLATGNWKLTPRPWSPPRTPSRRAKEIKRPPDRSGPRSHPTPRVRGRRRKRPIGWTDPPRLINGTRDKPILRLPGPPQLLSPALRGEGRVRGNPDAGSTSWSPEEESRAVAMTRPAPDWTCDPSRRQPQLRPAASPWPCGTGVPPVSEWHRRPRLCRPSSRTQLGPRRGSAGVHGAVGLTSEY
jgi:hypothetical protein